MKNFTHIPLVGLRNTLPPEPRKPGKLTTAQKTAKPHKYNAAQMFEDRISGMSWSQIAKKHGIKNGGRANHYLVNSQFMKTITPEQAEAFASVGRVRSTTTTTP